MTYVYNEIFLLTFVGKCSLKKGTGTPNTETDLSPRIDVQLHPFEYYNIINFTTLSVNFLVKLSKILSMDTFQDYKKKFSISRSAFHW